MKKNHLKLIIPLLFLSTLFFSSYEADAIEVIALTNIFDSIKDFKITVL